MNPNASTKSAKRYSRCSLPCCTDHPTSAPSLRSTSSAPSFAFAMDHFIPRPAGRFISVGAAPHERAARHARRLPGAARTSAAMNLLLVDPAELAGDGTCVVRDHRALHLRSVIGVRPGWHVRAGIARGGIGSAEIMADDG